MYIVPVDRAPDRRQQLPEEAKKFDGIDKDSCLVLGSAQCDTERRSLSFREYDDALIGHHRLRLDWGWGWGRRLKSGSGSGRK